MCHWGLDDDEGILSQGHLHSTGIVCDDNYDTVLIAPKFGGLPRLTHMFTYPISDAVFPINITFGP